MTRHTVQALLEARVLERVPPDGTTAREWFVAAQRHLTSAALLAEQDPIGAYLLLYDAARKALSAHMLANGLRVRAVPGAHRAVGVYAVEQLGSSAHGPDMQRYDAMRRNRNRAEYGIRLFGSAEVTKDLGHATNIVAAVEHNLET